MKITRPFAAKSFRLAAAAAFSFLTVTAYAGSGEERNATLINFSVSEGLKADDAAAILSSRLDLRTGIDELRSVYTEHPDQGIEVQRFNQYFKGVRVAHGTYTLMSKNGIASFAFGKYFNIDASTGITPAISEADALNSALQATNARKYMWQEDPSVPAPKGELQFVQDFSYGTPDNKVYLAYVFDIYAAEPLSRNMVYVDAQTGKILFKDAILKAISGNATSNYSGNVTFEVVQSGSVYQLHDMTRGTGIITYNLNGATASSSKQEVSSATTTFAKDPAVDAHWAAARVYDYWKTIRNRNGWNGANAQHISYVHYGSSVINAFWNGSAMNFGDGGSGYGALVSLDVCAHELGHGVCQSTASLIYSGESGGMNEGFSDIWGNVVEHWADPHESDAIAKDTWLVGEELGQPLRSMRNPKQYGQPDTYLGVNWVYTGAGCDNTNDNCGVHTNSGVLNYWFYLISVGGKGTNDNGNAYQVPAIGIDKAADIAYATELTLTNTSNYSSCRTASIAAATTLYGACSPEVEAVTRAWYAVGVGADYVACTSQVSFSTTAMAIDENAAANACVPSHVLNVPIVLNGPAPAGGNAVVTVTPIGGSAVAGIDYDLTSNTVTFNAGSIASQYIPLTVYDNGATDPNKYVDLALSVAANGSSLALSGVLDTIRVTISSDDHAPFSGNTEYHSVGGNATTANTSTPFLTGNANGRGQYIYPASELLASGLRAGVPITEISFLVAQKNSTQPITGYSVKMAHVTQNSFTSAFLNASFTTVYSGNYTTNSGWSPITFTTPFVWDGVSNILIEVCFANNTSVGSNDKVYASARGAQAATAWSGSASGCSLPLTGSNISYYRPVIRFIQVPPAPVASHAGDTRSWNIHKAQSVYFYTQSAKEIIAGVTGAHSDLGCVTAQVTKAGNGFVMAQSGVQRTVKEFELNSSQPVTADTFDVIIYLSNDELGNVDPTGLYMVQTTDSNDLNLLPSNTTIIPPGQIDISYGANWTGFRATFNHMKRFYLTNGQITLGVGTVAGKTDALWTGANPFRNAPVLHWNLNAQERVIIRLTDISGRVVYNTERMLDAGNHSLELASDASYAPGTYILQVIRPNGVFTRQMVKQ
jgi:Zn-dependent metalloprotease